MTTIITFHEGFAINDLVYFYFNEKNPVISGKIKAIDRIRYKNDDMVIYTIDIGTGYTYIPHCDIFKSKEMCRQYAKMKYVHSQEHREIIVETTFFAINDAPKRMKLLQHALSLNK